MAEVVEERSAEPVPLTAPRDGVPPVTTTPAALAEVARRLAAGTGPVAVDAERASGYRYGQRAFLVQLRRDGAGTALVDPVALPDLSSLAEALRGVEWVLHAASQDLPCLAEVGMRPDALFDTELAARLLGRPRVGLAAVVEDVLGLRLAKEHSAVDWSTRPLPEPWLRYAALDVEVLVEVRDALAAELEASGKAAWAREEFAAVAAAPPPAPRQDPWRRTSGLHRVRSRRQLEAVRRLWEARDELARRRDLAPGRVLPDRAIVEAAVVSPADEAALVALPVFGGRSTRRSASLWLSALEAARATPDSALPPHSLPGDGPPPPRVWPDRDPEAAARLARARDALAALSEAHDVPVENLVQPDAVRRLAWSPPEPLDETSVRAALRAAGARAWQCDLVGPPLSLALAPSPAPSPSPTPGAD